jgi:hypothetical protein
LLAEFTLGCVDVAQRAIVTGKSKTGHALSWFLSALSLARQTNLDLRSGDEVSSANGNV